jgi:mRNA interferase MazF
VRRGEIWVANLNPNRGAEVGKVRPVLVLQADPLIDSPLATVVVLPLTGQVRQDAAPLRVSVPARDGLRQASQVMVDQPRTVDKGRFGEGPLTVLRDEEMTRVERSLGFLLGLT